MIKLGEMVLKGVNCILKDKFGLNGLEKQSIGYTMIKLGQMVLKGVNWVHNANMSSYGLEMIQFSTQ